MNIKLLKNKSKTWWILVVGVPLAVILGLTLNPKPKTPEETLVSEPVTQEVETLTYGTWIPGQSREILGTIESESDIQLVAQVSGTIANVKVSTGDRVSQGQVLAEYQRQNDATQIAYLNAIANLDQTRASAQSSIALAEQDLLSAQDSLETTTQLEASKYNETFDTLMTKTINAKTEISQALNWADNIIGVSYIYKKPDATLRHIGAGNSLLRQSAWNQIETLNRAYAALVADTSTPLTEDEKINYARARLQVLKDTQSLIRDMDTLVRTTYTNRSFTTTDKNNYIAEAEAVKAGVDAEVISLQSAIAGARTSADGNISSLTSSDNRVQQATINLDLAKANAESQITAAESQLALAQASVSDLVIRAPFSGTVSQRLVDRFDYVSLGTPLFQILGDDESYKASFQITLPEYLRLQGQDVVNLRFENDEVIEVEVGEISTNINTQTQKVLVEVYFPTLPEETLVGSWVRLLMSLDTDQTSTLVPLSSISYEPGGAEILVIDNGKAIRKEVKTGSLVGQGVEILSGLTPGDIVIRHRNRVVSGQAVTPRP